MAHPAIEKAIAEQSKKLLHTSNLFFHEGQAELALRLTKMSGLDRAFFCNSGTEAWEAALKLARAHAGLLRSEGKTSVRSFWRWSTASTGARWDRWRRRTRRSIASRSSR